VIRSCRTQKSNTFSLKIKWALTPSSASPWRSHVRHRIRHACSDRMEAQALGDARAPRDGPFGERVYPTIRHHGGFFSVAQWATECRRYKWLRERKDFRPSNVRCSGFVPESCLTGRGQKGIPANKKWAARMAARPVIDRRQLGSLPVAPSIDYSPAFCCSAVFLSWPLLIPVTRTSPEPAKLAAGSVATRLPTSTVTACTTPRPVWRSSWT
jgi:hypothetical protein